MPLRISVLAGALVFAALLLAGLLAPSGAGATTAGCAPVDIPADYAPYIVSICYDEDAGELDAGADMKLTNKGRKSCVFDKQFCQNYTHLLLTNPNWQGGRSFDAVAKEIRISAIFSNWIHVEYNCGDLGPLELFLHGC
jgi:hypothetical protein